LNWSIVIIEQDTDTGASYLVLADDTVARTIELSDLVMVDVNAAGEPIGVEFVSSPENRDAIAQGLSAVIERWPHLKETVGPLIGRLSPSSPNRSIAAPDSTDCSSSETSAS
jgi:uncharacterized protein YuzE